MATNNLWFHYLVISLTVIRFKSSTFLSSSPTMSLLFSTGAHLNPAVTLSFCVLGETKWSRLVPYSFSQVLGAYVASGIVYLVYYGSSFWHLKHFTIGRWLIKEKTWINDWRNIINAEAKRHKTLLKHFGFSFNLSLCMFDYPFCCLLRFLCFCLRCYYGL